MENFFNVAGPCTPAKHYMLPATERLPDVMRLIRQEQYFAIHAARQSGKTTLMQGLVRDINASGERVALYFTVESVMAYPDPHDGIFNNEIFTPGHGWCPEDKRLQPEDDPFPIDYEIDWVRLWQGDGEDLIPGNSSGM